MAQCNWDPKKHGGKPCPVHGGGGLWDENVFTRNEKLKKAGYTKEDLEDEDLKEDFDGDYDEEFEVTDEDISSELSDYWQITDKTTVDDCASDVAKKLGIDKQRVFEVMKKEAPMEITPDMKMADILDNEEDEDNKFSEEEIDYENVEYPKGTSKEYTNIINKKYQESLPILEKAGIKLEDFGGKASEFGGYEDNSKEIMEKYVFEPFRKKYPKGDNNAWDKEYQALYDAIESVLDKKYNDWYIKNKK